MKRAITAASMIAALVLPAFAADEYYVVQDVKTKKGTVYRTRSEAVSSMKSLDACRSN